MKTKINQLLSTSLVAASYFISSTSALAFVNQSQADATDNQNGKSIADKIDKRRTAVLTPKWSLPFQGQLGANAIVADKKELATKTSLGNGLALFTPKKYQVLTLKPQETLNNTLIADASNVTSTEASVQKTGKLISGEISAWDGPFNVDRIVNHLLDTHFENSPEGQKLDKQVKRHAGLGHRALAVTKDSFQYAIEYQGIGPSTRGGKLVLDSPDLKIRNKAWADYVRQKYIDKIHAQVVSSLMQISEGIGNSESDHGAQTIAAGKAELAALVGSEEAEKAVKALTLWLNNTNFSYATFAQRPWNTMERSKKLEEVLTAAVNHDPVIAAVTKRVNKYANPGTLQLRSSQVIQPALNLCSLLSPGYIGTAIAEPLLVGYKIGTGGSEENKLEREMLFDKRIQSRLKVLNQEASLALDNYRYALITKNPPLLAFSQEVVENLTGSSNSLNSAGVHDVDVPDSFVPEIKESEQRKIKDMSKLSKVKYLVKSTNNLLN